MFCFIIYAKYFTQQTQMHMSTLLTDTHWLKVKKYVKKKKGV